VNYESAVKNGEHCTRVFGSWFCGLGVKVHSGALICPPDAVINPNQ